MRRYMGLKKTKKFKYKYGIKNYKKKKNISRGMLVKKYKEERYKQKYCIENVQRYISGIKREKV